MKVEELPDKPGIYLFMDYSGSVIYIGKAKSLKKRVKSHFGRDNLNSRHIAMISQVSTVDYVLTKGEKEALLLEEQLIKNIQPRYNIALRDGKTYPFLEITLAEDFPALRITRIKKKNPDSKYYGPFPNAGDVKAVKKVIDRIFPIRKCRKFKPERRPCLNWQMGRCIAPCTGNADEKLYSMLVEEITLFLSGDHKKLISRLKDRMLRCKNRMEYEKAAAVRDQISQLENFFPLVNFRKVTRKKIETMKKVDPLGALKDLLGMPVKPEVIEGYDVSHTASRQAVGSMVVFRNAEPDPSSYRKFRIKQERTSDDLKMMREVIYRRFRRMLDRREIPPDIILVDGGRTQEKTAHAVLAELDIKNIEVLALAKETYSIYHSGKNLLVKTDSAVFRLLKSITDEAHRFAISYHRSRRTGIPKKK
jgi:excinuclease ABC subunit C